MGSLCRLVKTLIVSLVRPSKGQGVLLNCCGHLKIIVCLYVRNLKGIFCCYIQTLSLTILDILCHVVCTCVQSYYRRIQLLYCLQPQPVIAALHLLHL